MRSKRYHTYPTASHYCYWTTEAEFEFVRNVTWLILKTFCDQDEPNNVQELGLLNVYVDPRTLNVHSIVRMIRPWLFASVINTFVHSRTVFTNIVTYSFFPKVKESIVVGLPILL
jgi:hypothetical protein